MNVDKAMITHAEEHPGLGEHELAASFLKAHPRRILEPFLAALLAAEFVHLARREVRLAEISALKSLSLRPRALRSAEQVRSELGYLTDLLDREYRIGDGVGRRAGSLTLPEWEVRRDMLVAQRKGIERSLEIAELAISTLRKTGAATLDDVGAVALAA